MWELYLIFFEGVEKSVCPVKPSFGKSKYQKVPNYTEVLTEYQQYAVQTMNFVENVLCFRKVSTFGILDVKRVHGSAWNFTGTEKQKKTN